MEKFLRVLELLRREARYSTLTGLLEKTLAETRLDSLFAAMPGGEARAENLQTFFQYACDFENGTHRSLAAFLDHLDRMQERGLVVSGTAGAGCISIMSIHKSKGLEFPVVFLCNLSRRFNQEDLRAQILCDKELGLGLSAVDRQTRVRYPSLAKRAIGAKMAAQSISEEMRVLYVAMTRAKDRLVMTYASQTLEKDLQAIALRRDFDGGELLCREADCMGDWVLLAAMGRIEAGALHAIGGRPETLTHGEYLWRIETPKPQEAQTQASGEEPKETAAIPENLEEMLKSALSYRYAHTAATQTPSKQTATGRKGRQKDAEAAESAGNAKPAERSWRQPDFLSRQASGKTYGSAMHAALQYIRYEDCGSSEAVSREIQRLVKGKFLTQDQGSLVRCDQLARFFQSEIGMKLRSGTRYLREFKFSILDAGRHYGEGLEDEQVLLQGVVDCALLEEDGITILDFKTDRVTEETVVAAADRYRLQVETYADALTRIYEMPVKARYLYFFSIDRFVEV